MSQQYPYDPQNPQPSWPAHVPMDPYASFAPNMAARLAGVVQIVLASLMLLCGTCCSGFGMMVSSGSVPAEDLSKIETELSTSGVDISAQALLLGIGLALLVPAVVTLVAGIFVWRRSMAATIASLAIFGLGAAIMGLMTLLALVGAASAQQDIGQVIASLVMMALMLAAMVVQVILLIRALMERRKAPAAQTAPPWQYPQYQYPPAPPAPSTAPQNPDQPPPPPTI